MEKTKTPRAFIIFLWRNCNAIEGASRVKTLDGIDEVYRHGWMIEKEDKAKRNEDKHREWRARVKTKNLLNNTLNVLNWYGRKVLDDRGNVSKEKYNGLELNLAFEIARKNESIRRKNLIQKKNLPLLDMNDIKKIRKFPVKNITIQEAKQYGF